MTASRGPSRSGTPTSSVSGRSCSQPGSPCSPTLRRTSAVPTPRSPRRVVPATMGYVAPWSTEGPLPPERQLLEAALFSALESRRRDELDRGVTLVGPHRDDVLLSLGDLAARGYASHGESWSYALALRLASYDLLRADADADGEPVLLLDDVFAELDSDRRDRLASPGAPAPSRCWSPRRSPPTSPPSCPVSASTSTTGRCPVPDEPIDPATASGSEAAMPPAAPDRAAPDPTTDAVRRGAAAGPCGGAVAARRRGLRPREGVDRPRGRSIVATSPGRAASPDDRDPQPLGRAVRRLVRERGWTDAAAVGGVVGRWAEIVGPEIAAHAVVERFDDGRLLVRASSTAWATQLRLMVGTMRARLDAELGPTSCARSRSWARLPRPGGRGRATSRAAALATPSADSSNRHRRASRLRRDSLSRRGSARGRDGTASGTSSTSRLRAPRGSPPGRGSRSRSDGVDPGRP